MGATNPRQPLRAISLFSNCGAGDVGFAEAGFQFEVMAELDPRRLAVALLNHPKATGIPGDLRVTLPSVIASYRRRAGATAPALLAACPPCQGMSSAQSGRGLGSDPDAGSKDERNLLVKVIADAVNELNPRTIVVENVQAFLMRKVRHPRTGVAISAANYLIDELADRYAVYPLSTDLADFGIPQSRKRSFLTFILRTEPALEMLSQRGKVPYPWASHSNSHSGPVSLESALKSFGLDELDARNKITAVGDLPMHRVPIWSEQLYRMVNAIPPSSGLSAWDNLECLTCGTRARDPKRVRCSRCRSVLPRPITKNSDGELRLVRGFHSSYRRMSPDEPAATITTASGHVGSDRTIHPWENRVLSPLECALLQTFPLHFKWGDALEEWGHTNVRAMIGEAVPPLFTKKHGRTISQLLRGVPPRLALDDIDRRVQAAFRSLGRSSRDAILNENVNVSSSTIKVT